MPCKSTTQRCRSAIQFPEIFLVRMFRPRVRVFFVGTNVVFSLTIAEIAASAKDSKG